MAESQNQYDKWKNPDKKEYVFYDSTYMIFQKSKSFMWENTSIVSMGWEKGNWL